MLKRLINSTIFCSANLFCRVDKTVKKWYNDKNIDLQVMIMDKFEIFRKELNILLSLKEDLFEKDPDCDEKIKNFENENHITMPQELRYYYQVTGRQEKIHQNPYTRIFEIENLQISHNDQYGDYLFFASSAYETYGYFFNCHKLMKSSESRQHWQVKLFSDLDSLLIHSLAESMLKKFDNHIFVKLRYPKDEHYRGYISDKLNIHNFTSIGNEYYTAFYDENKKILALFDYDEVNRLLLACDNREALSEAAKSHQFVWKRQNGKKVHNPSKFVKGECPASFEEKLEMIRSAVPYARKVKYKSIDNGLPESLNYFYNCFSKTEDFFNSDMEIVPMNDIDKSKEWIYFSYENQGVFGLALKNGTSDVYITYDDKEYSKLNDSLEEVLIFAACHNAMALMEVVCEADKNDIEDLTPFFFELSHTESSRCFVNPTRKILMIYDRDSLFLSARTDWYMNTLEDDSGVAFDYL